MGQNVEVMPRPLNSPIVIYSLKARTIFSPFVLKKHMLGFAHIISVFRTGWRFARVGVGTRYPEHQYYQGDITSYRVIAKICAQTQTELTFLTQS